MFISKQITSPQNTFVKFLVSLRERKGRNQSGMFLIEGHREVERAMKHGWEIREIVFCPEAIPLSEIEKIVPPDKRSQMELIELTRPVYEKLAYRETGINLLATCKQKKLTLNELNLPKHPLVVALEGLEKPGNIGAILRTTDAAGVDAVIICDPLTDIYNPNIVRSSLGCLFTQPIAVCSSEEAINWLIRQKITIAATHLEGATVYHKIDFTKGVCIAMGTENSGLTDLWRQAPAQLIKIPMRGEADSLNVSTSAAIVVYEALRQRG